MLEKHFCFTSHIIDKYKIYPAITKKFEKKKSKIKIYRPNYYF